jgi:hypothetical protein
MEEEQTNLNFDLDYSTAPTVVPELRDEIARAWGLPLGQRAAVTGVLELRSTPDFPWNPKQTLRLHIRGLEFSSREIERWTLL